MCLSAERESSASILPHKYYILPTLYEEKICMAINTKTAGNTGSREAKLYKSFSRSREVFLCSHTIRLLGKMAGEGQGCTRGHWWVKPVQCHLQVIYI